MADPHDIDIAVEDAPPSSGEVPNPLDPGGGMGMQGGNHQSSREDLGSGHSVINRDVADRSVEEIVPDDGGEGQWERTHSPSLPGTECEHFQPNARNANGERNGEVFQLVEADHDGAWFKAIQAKDDSSLLQILNGKEDDASRVALCLETGEGGRTALHVAAMQGCFRLAKQVIDLIYNAYDPSGELVCPSKELKKFTRAKDGEFGRTALEMANGIGNTSISEAIRHVRMEPQEKKKYRGMFEANQGTLWDTALVQGDCGTLWRLLRHNSHFLLQTCSTNGLSVLDVAIMKDDEELVETVVSAFEPGGDKIAWPEESYFPSELTWEQIAERHYDEDPRFMGRFSNLKNLATLGVGNAETGRSPGPVTSAVQLAEECGSSVEIKGLLSKVGKHVERSTVDREESGDDEEMFIEAKHGGAWFKAIEARDCLSLMEQLLSVHAEGGDALCLAFCRKTGEKGRTALHVAAMQGCFRLAKQLIDLTCKKYTLSGSPEVMEESYDVYGKEGIDSSSMRLVHLSEAAFIFTRAKDGRSGLTALEMANDIIGNTSISQYMLHVGIKPEEMMYEAYGGTEWHTALAQGDCKKLRKLLKSNSRFLLQTCGINGLSVLDVAIMKNDKELVETVVCAFGSARDKISWAPESYFPSELTWEQIAHRHYDEGSRFHELSSTLNYAELGLSYVKSIRLRRVRSAHGLAEKFGSSEEVKRLLGEVGEHVQGTTGDGEDFDPLLLEILSEQGVFESSKTKPLEYMRPEFLSLEKVAKRIEQRWKSKWTAGFLADVDYNFEDKSSLRFSILRFHYACKHFQLCEQFIFDMIDSSTYYTFEKKDVRDIIRWLPSLFAMCDGQGRTPLHTMVEHDNHNHCLKMVHSSFYLLNLLYHLKQTILKILSENFHAM
jgi:hypothetical protein